MKRFHSRTSIFALVFMMLCSMLVTVPVSTNAEEAEEEVLKYYANLDTNMAWDGWRVHQDGQYVQYNNVNNPTGTENVNVTADKSEFFITLDKTAVWQGRLQFYNYYTDTGSPIVFGQDKIVVETKFKVKAQSYSESVPHLGIMLTWNGNKTLLMPEEIPLLADTESDYHTVKYTFDPVARTITGELDGRVLVNSSIPNDITELSNFFFTPIAQNVPYSQSFGGYTDNQPLNNTVTWNFDCFKVYSTGKAQESGETERIELFSLDNNIRQHGTGQPILVEESATNGIWIEDYSASKAITETPVIADDKTNFSLRQVKTSAWSLRFNMRDTYGNYFQPATDKHLEVEVKVKVTPDGTPSTTPSAELKLDAMNVVSGRTISSGALNISSESEEKWNTVRYEIIPEENTVKCYVNDELTRTGALSITTDVYQTLGFQPVGQNAAGGNEDDTALNTPLNWVFDSFKVTEIIEHEAEPEPGSEKIEIMSVDTNLKQHVASPPVLVEDGSSNSVWLDDWSGTSVINAPTIASDLSSFSFEQIKTTAYGLRMNFKNLYGSAFQPSSKTHYEIEVKAKIAPTDFESDAYKNAVSSGSGLPVAKLQFEGQGVVAGGLLETNALTLATPDEENWHTISFDVDPDANTAVCYVDGDINRQSPLSITGDVYTMMGLRPIVQNDANSSVDAADLNIPVTWTFDSIKVYEVKEVVQETTKTETMSVDTNLKQHVASPPVIVENGASNAVWIEDWSGTSVINAPSIAADLSSFSFEQIKTTAYGLRMNFKNLYGSAYQPSSSEHYEIEVKVKVAPADFNSEAYKTAVSSGTGLPAAKLQFEGRDVLSGGGLIETNALSLSTQTAENWHTISYDVNPDTNTVICYVDGEMNRQSPLSVTGDVYTAMGLRPIVQNDESSSVDAAELNIPVTWTFDSIKVYEVKEAQTPEPTPSLEPVVLPTEKPIPENLASLVTRTYPDGKMKAAVMSYDDAAPWMWENAGSDGSKLNSEERFLDILNKYHIKATFNTVTELVKNRGLTAQWYVDKYLLDKDGNPTGHEIASHSANHVYWEEVSTMDDPRSYLMNEMTTSKEFVESVLGEGSCRGYAFPGSFPTAESFEDLLFNAGYTYYRGGNNPSSDPFMVPDTFYNWPVTMWFGGKDDQYSLLLNYMDRFKNLDPGQEFKVFFMWGHSHDFGKGIAGYTNPDNPSDANYQTAESQVVGFERLEEWCQFLNENADTIWNPTCLEYADYVNAVRQLDVTDDGNGNIAVHNPSDSITCYVKVENDVYSVEPGEDIFVTPSEPLPTAPALSAPVSSGAWESPLYAPDTDKDNRKDDSELLTGKTIDLGDTYRVNKVEIDHDSDKIMSFTIMTSTDNETFTPVTDVYPGGVDEYTGKQIYRFPTTSARYVKYHVVLMGDYETQGKLNDMTVSYVDTESLDISALPNEINPLEEQEIVLNASANEENGESYTLNNEGVVWSVKAISPEGVKVDGHVLKIDKNTAAGEITVTARDAGNGIITAQKTIKVVPDVFVRDFALYADDSFSQPLTGVTAGEEVFIKATLYGGNTVENKNVSIFGALYSQSGELISVVPMAEAEASDEETAVTASMRISDTFNPETDSIKVYIWHTDTLKPVTEAISYGVNNGINAKRVYLDKSETFLMSALSDTAVSYESSDTDVAEVDNSGTVTGTGEGIATISAKADGKVIGTAQVQVQPSLYVYLMLGQSNMSGTNDPGKEGVDVSISDGVMLLNQYGEFEPAEHRFSRYSGIWWEGSYHDGIQENGYYPSANPTGGINMGYSFAEDFVAEHSDTEIGLVVNSQAGCSIGVYEKLPQNEECNGFVNTLERVRQATAGRGELKAILWHQGESDQNQVTYPARFRNLMYDLRREIGDLELPVLAGGLLEQELNTSVHNDRMENEMNNIANYGFVSSSEPSYLQSCKEAGGFSGDSLDLVHLSARGQIEFGHRYYNMYKDIENKMKK